MPYDNTNRGSIWKNKRKEKAEHPDFTGSLDVDGVAYWVNAWKRKDDASPEAPALTFSVRRKEAKPATMPAARTDGQRVMPRTRTDLDDDQIPFAPEVR